MTSIAVSTQLFGAQELTAAHLEMIRQSGFQAIEVFAAPGHFEWQDEGSVARIARTARNLGLIVTSLHAPWAPGQDIAALDAEQREASIQAVERAVDALLVLGGDILILHPGAALPSPETKEEQLRLSRQSIARVARYCAARGVRVALENPPPYELGGDSLDMRMLYEHFAHEPVIQACFDTGHAHLSTEGVFFARDISKELLVVHISDNSGQADDHLPPPMGTIPWPDFLAVLRERHFDGSLVLELTDLPHPEQVLAAGWEWMNQALKRISGIR